MHSADNHRHCFLLKGSTNEVLSDFLHLSAQADKPLICAYDVSDYNALLKSKQPFITRTFKQVRQELGCTHDAVLVDLTEGISASVLAILSGTVRGNGIFAIALPNNDWLSLVDQDLPRYLPWPYKPEQIDSSFKRFFLQRLESQYSPFQPISRKSIQALPALPTINHDTALTQDQTQVQASLLDQQTESYVLIAPRGRGKSTLLGDSIAKLLLAGKRVAITAPNQAAISTLRTRFEQVALSINLDKDLPFYAPDALLANDTQWDYVFVDEASMIPVPLLIALNQKAKHSVFSTTDYGYEGAGKGFGIRFCQYLRQQTSSVTELTLQKPIRWGENDPLEKWINDCFFLGFADPVNKADITQSPSLYQEISGKEWLQNTSLLAQTFRLLVSAHYQTSSDNLRWILDDPSVSTFLSLQNEKLSSVAIVTEEGDLPDSLCLEVMQGTRRPRGHLVPQSLLAHEGITDAGQYTYWRISRIATEHSLQNQGLGSDLIRHIEKTARGQCDFLCTSFAATPDVVNFWLKNGFIPVRLGTSKDQASGCYSLMMVKPLHTKADQLATTWHEHYLANLTLNLPRDYQDLPSELTKALTPAPLNSHQETLSQKDKHDLSLFAYQHRPYLTIRAQLTRLTQTAIESAQLTSSHPEYDLLESLITQPHDQLDFSKFGLKSKKQAEKHLKKVVKTLLENQQ